jgi:F-type H+-transporting ATPase subunit c
MKHMNRIAFFVVTTFAALPAFAQEAAMGGDKGLKYLAAAIAISVAALGGALAQGKAASTALEGIARNPSATDKIQTPMIIGLALIESLVIYALIIALKLAEFF